MSAVRAIGAAAARRLAIARQRLAGPLMVPTGEGIMDVVRDLGCLQLDPTRAVAQSHLLVLWSRLGGYDVQDLERLRWSERRLFDYWAHAASIVLTEDFPIHSATMRRWGKADTSWSSRARAWMEENASLRRYVLASLRRRGPLGSSELEDRSSSGWVSTGWTRGRNVDRMLTFLWVRGKVLVAGRRGQERLWDLAERVLPPWTPRERLSEREVVRRAAQRSLRALGVARVKEIDRHFTRGDYPDLRHVLDGLEAEGRIARVRVATDGSDRAGTWYVHADDLPLLEQIEDAAWEPRTTLLSPFDNLICDRERTELLFGFRFRLEIYVPKAKREYGFFVMPILHGDRLVGRVDPTMDRRRGTLVVNALHLERDARATPGLRAAVAGSIRSLAAFLGAGEVEPGPAVPGAWKRALS